MKKERVTIANVLEVGSKKGGFVSDAFGKARDAKSDVVWGKRKRNG